MRSLAVAAGAYGRQGHDAVRSSFESDWFARRIRGLLREAGGPDVLDLGCGDCAAAELAGPGIERYVGVDLSPRPPAEGTGLASAEVLRHDLREGLGPVGRRPFDLYLGTFGIASHLEPQQLRRLLGELVGHARPGAIVALEALGLRSLEWPRLWESAPGAGRTIGYRMAQEVEVHPWAPSELAALFEASGIRPLRAFDRTLQAGPKLGEGRYWPGLPDVRGALNALLEGRPGASAVHALGASLPPLPAGRAALIHQALAGRRASLARQGRLSASAIWKLEPRTGGGFGHGLLLVGRVRA